MNLISFIRLIVFDKFITSEIIINYFLLQSFNSYLYIISSINLNFINNTLIDLIAFILNLSILTKIGLPPFYVWYLKVINKLNWINLIILITIQKFIPLIILNNLINLNNEFIIKFNIINLIFISFISALLGLNQINLKLLMCYSSIIQIRWLIILIFLNELIWMNYFILYIYISIRIIVILNKFRLNYLSNLNLLKLNNRWIYFILILNIIRLARIPPLFGFIIKWIRIQTIIDLNSFYIIIIIIINSLIRIFFYLRTIFNSLINYFRSIKLNFLIVKFRFNFNYKIIIYSWINVLLLLIYEII